MNYLKIIMPVILSIAFVTYLIAQSGVEYDHSKNPYYSHTNAELVKVSDEEWKKILPPAVYQIAREQGTERAFTGKYWNNHAKGTYYCAVCGNPLYSSETKFDSHTGWPSFYKPLNKNSIGLRPDSDGDRTEVSCKRCGSHLGHVFNDGPPPTGDRFCMDGNVLDFEPSK